jgi:hypothetical protein
LAERARRHLRRKLLLLHNVFMFPLEKGMA